MEAISTDGASTVAPNKAALMSCSTCAQQIAISATACPHCGASNSYEHPKIAAFKSASLQISKPFEFECSGTVVKGKTNSARDSIGGWVGITMMLGAVLSFMLPFIGVPLLCLSFILAGVWVFSSDSADTFSVDCSSGTPNWSSSNDELFAPIRDFFVR